MTRGAVLAILLLIAACGDAPREARVAREAKRPAPREACMPEWRNVADGVRYRTTPCNSSGGFVLHVVEIDPAKWQIDAVAGPRRAMAAAVAESGARFAINANFFDRDDRALGVVIASGKSLQPAHPVSWQSIFWLDRKGRPAITARDGWDRVSQRAFAAVQAGPRLMIDGQRNRVAKGTPSLRSGVCIASSGALRFFVTPQTTFVDVLEMVELAASLECRDAMLFDGGPSAQMYLDTPGKKIAMQGDVVPVYVIARPR